VLSVGPASLDRSSVVVMSASRNSSSPVEYRSGPADTQIHRSADPNGKSG